MAHNDLIELSEEQLDFVTGGGATVSGPGPGVIVTLASQASSTAVGGGIESANSNALPNPATLMLPT
jgi:hypothetical protein